MKNILAENVQYQKVKRPVWKEPGDCPELPGQVYEKRYERLYERMDEDGLDVPAVAAAICYRSNVSRTNMTKPDCVKLFGCNKNNFESYVESPEFTDAGIRRPRAKDFMLRRLIKRGE